MGGAQEMSPSDFVYDQIFKGALAKNASERSAQTNAQMGLADFNKNKLGEKKVSKLIEARITQAVTDTKKGR